MVDEPQELDKEQLALYLIESGTYRFLWYDGYLLMFHDHSDWTVDLSNREIISLLFISHIQYMKTPYTKFVLLDRNCATVEFSNQMKHDANIIIYPVVVSNEYYGKFIIEKIKEGAGNAEQG